MKKENVFLIAVFLIGFFVRFYRLGDIPAGLHRDEAFLGYNAYSILKTGKDINGNFLPFHLESFIYSPAGYSYFSIPSIYIFDLNPFSIRFPSALFGSLTVILTFFLVRKIFEEDKFKNIAILSSFFIALSPWHINLSRTSTENTIVVFLITLGSLLFLRCIKTNKPNFFLLSFILFGLTLLVYQAPRAFLPFFIPLLFFCFVPRNFKHKSFVLILYFLIIIMPLFLILLSPNLSSRIKSLNIFNHPETQLTIDENLREDGVNNIPKLTSRIFHNKLTGYSSLILQNYFKHFSYDFLFADNSFPERYKVSQMGLLYIFELPLIILGVFYVLTQTKKRKTGLFLLTWVILAPIGSSLTFDDVPNLQRTLIVFPAISIISASGFIYFISLIKKLRYFRLLIYVSCIVFSYGVLFYFHQYYVHSVVHRPWFRQEGYKELVTNINNLLPRYKNAVVTNRETAPSIFFLFYNKYDPNKFQTETKSKFTTNSDSVNFGKYIFTDKECPLRSIAFGEKTNEKLFDSLNTGENSVLYVNSGNCKRPKIPVNELYTIKRNDGSVVFRIFEVRKEF